MNFQNLKALFINNGCKTIYAKKLSPNDNSKNQVYLGGNFEILNILPISEIKTVEAGDWNRERFKAQMNFWWISDLGNLFHAPRAQLILYPKYPEVRFSGFLLQCENPPSDLMNRRLENRILFLSVDRIGRVLGYVSSGSSSIAQEISLDRIDEQVGVFKVINLVQDTNTREQLLNELSRIHRLGWIGSKRLDSLGDTLPCNSPNCGGYTLEAELGVKPNGYSEPDFLGWEVKQFGVKSFEKLESSVITLMTPEPTHGIYKSQGVDYFLHNYGYPDKKGREDRINFGGIHRVNLRHVSTKLELKLIGFDQVTGKIRNADGKICLLDKNGIDVASWSFSSLLKHWNRKHNQACYVPSQSKSEGGKMYKYGDKVILGTGTDFQLFLLQMANGNIYYDPGIKMENVSGKSKVKKRSQFRIRSKNLKHLYRSSEVVKV